MAEIFLGTQAAQNFAGNIAAFTQKQATAFTKPGGIIYFECEAIKGKLGIW
jgi:hypothetical protein